MVKKSSFTKAEKWTLFFVSAFVVTITITFWQQEITRTPVIHIPTPVMPATNAKVFYLKAFRSFVPYQIPTSTGPYPLTYSNLEVQFDNPKLGTGPGIAASHGMGQNGSEPLPSLSELQGLSRVNAPAFAVLHAGFAHEYRETPARSFNTLFPQFGQFRALARFLMVDAKIKRLSGDWNGAANDAIDCIRLGEDIPRGSPLIGMLVGIAVQAIGRDGLEETIGHLNATQARLAAQRLEEAAHRHTTVADAL